MRYPAAGSATSRNLAAYPPIAVVPTRAGDGSSGPQAAIALCHMTRPMIESLSAIFGGAMKHGPRPLSFRYFFATRGPGYQRVVANQDRQRTTGILDLPFSAMIGATVCIPHDYRVTNQHWRP